MKSVYLLLTLLVVAFSEAYPNHKREPTHNSTNPIVASGFMPRSCLEYLQQGSRESDFYQLYDDLDQVYVVFCDLSYEPGSAWTLVVSWVTQKYLDLPYFKNKAFSDDAPVNENTPNWNIYRQTWARMNSIRKHSTHWRATCNFNWQSRIDYLDYLRGKFSDFDIMTWYGSRSECKPLEFISILGKTGGRGSTAGFWQNSDSFFLHIDNVETTCSFVPPPDPSADYFGYYGDGINTAFRCSLYDDSTTQWWFGGYLEED